MTQQSKYGQCTDARADEETSSSPKAALLCERGYWSIHLWSRYGEEAKP